MELIKFTDKYGTKRKGYKKVCESCEDEYVVSKARYEKSKFCSKECRNKGNEREKSTLTCPVCNETFIRLNSTLKAKSGIYFCSVVCKDKAATISQGIEQIWPSFYGTGKDAYRKLFTKKELKCKRCGFDEFKECVDVHHIDGDHTNNDKNNLMPLCSCCHRALHIGLWKL